MEKEEEAPLSPSMKKKVALTQMLTMSLKKSIKDLRGAIYEILKQTSTIH
jgi:hypothetical protein